MIAPTRVTYDDLPPEVLRVACNFIRDVFYNQEDDAPYDEEPLAKNVACHVLQAAGWSRPVPDEKDSQ